MSSVKPERALVAGAGIGGLAAAIALRNAGFDPLVLERAERTREAGAGLLLGANAVAALHGLGMHETASGLGVPTTAGLLRDPSGKTLADLRLPAGSERLGADSMAVSRPELMSALAAEASKTGDVVRPGCRVAGLRRTEEGVAAVLEGGGEERGRIMVGADGLSSTVRGSIQGATPPRYAGYTAWRGVAYPGEGVVPRGVGLETWGRGVRFGCVYIGGGRVYWFATQNAPEGARDAPGESRRRVLGLLRGWHDPIEALVRATPEEEIRRDDIYDRDPIPRWGQGPVTLLGDAAHPMTPNLGQGAGQALVDAAALGESLSRSPGCRDLEAGLRMYERRRALPAAALVLLSRYAGVAGQLRTPALTRLRDRAFRAAPRRLKELQLQEQLGYRSVQNQHSQHNQHNQRSQRSYRGR
jgi:2-polyprenyl-6-methoxyphenol hydroxylase-like FAD-dependent oxidoreductase